MKIAIIGSRGIPPSYGGFETFTYELARFLVIRGNEVTVVNEKGGYGLKEIDGIKIIYSKYKKSKKPLRFYYNSLALVKRDYDIVLVCGVGGSLFYKLVHGKAIIVTNVDGLEHLRGKYTFIQKLVVRFLQRVATITSDYLVADSEEVKLFWVKKQKISAKKIEAFYYGAHISEKYYSSLLDKYRLIKDSYYLIVARLVPENNIEMVINSFSIYAGNKKLIIVGDINDNNYSKNISKNEYKNVIFVGGVYDKQMLDGLRVNAFAYIHGHSVGGTNPALLEAMASSCICICHDNVFNKEVTNNEQLYFDSVSSLKLLLHKLESNGEREKFKIKAKRRVSENYTWDRVGAQYNDLFQKLIQHKK